MSASELGHVTTPPENPRPRSVAGIRIELTESSAAGWTLTVRTDAETAAALRSASVATRNAGAVSITIAPNLVPGGPFTVDALRLEIDAPSTPAPQDGVGR